MEGGSEIGAVDGGVPGGFRVVEVFAFGTVELYGFYVWVVGEAGWEERL